MLSLLRQAIDKNALRSLDLQMARLFAGDDNPLLTLAIAWLSAEVGTGHVCLPISWLRRENLFNGRLPELAEQIWAAAGQPERQDWVDAITGSPSVGDGTTVTPFVFQDDRFYLQRMWLDEGRIAQFFNQPSSAPAAEINVIKEILDRLFDGSTHSETDWQKVAAAVAVTEQVAVISGGPGTGKTTTVAKLLAALILLSEQGNLRITLAAPTGKAAARLTESLASAVASLPLNERQKALIPTEASTIHRLLGVRQNSQRLKYHQDNPLHVDVLVVDEASMIDLPMMARVIAALPQHARFILLGDREQLASVEAGAVLGDICRFAELGYSPAKRRQLSALTGYRFENDELAQAPAIRDSLCLLRKSYRFNANSGIGQLAMAINRGDTAQVSACLKQPFADVEWHPMADSDDYQALIAACVQGYRHYLTLLSTAPPETILAEFGKFQLLCALRDGAYGVQGLNERIEQGLSAQRLIRKNVGWQADWYAGRPVMVNRNDSSLGLYNGDIGIALYDENHELRVYFQLPDGTVRSVQTHRLPKCDTAFAMTVHKSQGSEFNHTVLVLPHKPSPLLTRELVYTAITRARQQLTLFATENILLAAVRKPTERRSGLAERLI
jgi:exodeoxyribonuclease V alpha subunit